MRLSAAFPLVLALGALTGCEKVTVIRVVDGHEVFGRFISDYAYALYGRAAEADVGWHNLPAAIAALEEAAREDPSSPEVWTMLGAIRCRNLELDHAEQAFEQARTLDPEYAPAYREEARCDLFDGSRRPSADGRTAKLRKALEAGQRSIALDPDDLDATTLTAESLVGLGQIDEARRLLFAMTVREPAQPGAYRALYAFGRANHDEALVRRAGRRLRELGVNVDDAASLSPLAEIDEALGRDDLVAARRVAHHARLPLSEVAVRAAALGRIAVARSQAEIIVGADPGDTSARIALAVAADLAGDGPALAAAMTAIPATPDALTPPSPLARLLFAEVLDRRVGPQAARDFLGPFPEDKAPGDDLRAQIERRVRARLGK